MLIIFDGPDNCGKTSIAKLISKIETIRYFKHQGVTKLNFRDPNVALVSECNELYSLDLIKTLNMNVLIDRHYPSDFVYGHIYRNRSEYSLRKVDEFMSNIVNHLIVICYKDALVPKIDNFVPDADIKVITDRFKYFYEWSHSRVLLLNTTDQNIMKQVEAICGAIEDVKSGEFFKRKV